MISAKCLEGHLVGLLSSARVPVSQMAYATRHIPSSEKCAKWMIASGSLKD